MAEDLSTSENGSPFIPFPTSMETITSTKPSGGAPAKSLQGGLLLHGDCIPLLQKELRTESVDLVLTDPPYLVNYHDRTGRTLAHDIQGDWLEPAFREIARVLKPDRFCISFYGWNKAELFLTAWKKAGLYPVGHIVFVKSYASAQRFLRYRHESAYLLAKGRPEMPTRVLPDVLEWRYTGNKRHPTEKPLMALIPLIDTFSRAGDVILDPFMGSGSTLVAARMRGRQVVGIELDAGYYRNAAARLRKLELRRSA